MSPNLLCLLGTEDFSSPQRTERENTRGYKGHLIEEGLEQGEASTQQHQHRETVGGIWDIQRCQSLSFWCR